MAPLNDLDELVFAYRKSPPAAEKAKALAERKIWDALPREDRTNIIRRDSYNAKWLFSILETDRLTSFIVRDRLLIAVERGLPVEAGWRYLDNEGNHSKVLKALTLAKRQSKEAPSAFEPIFEALLDEPPKVSTGPAVMAHETHMDNETIHTKLDRLITEANDKNKARFTIGLLMCSRLSCENEQWSRKELVAAPERVKKAGTAIASAASSVNWQRQFLQRMSDLGWIEQGGDPPNNVFYQSVDSDARKALLDVVANALDGDKVKLCRLLWPSEYPEDEPTGAELGQGTSPEAEPPQEDPGLDVVREVAQNLALVANQLGQVITSLQGLHDLQETANKLLLEKVDSLAGLDTRMSESVQGFQTLFTKMLAAMENEERQQITTIMARLIDNGARKTSAVNQLESIGRQDEKLHGLLEALVSQKAKVA